MNNREEINRCERCGAILDHNHVPGCDKSGIASYRFCSYCLKDGIYTFDDEVDDELKRNIYEYVVFRKDPKENISRERLLNQIINLIDGLKRWSIYSLAQHEYYYAFNRCLLYINENLSKELTLKEIANVAGISGYHFHRLFTSAFQETPGQYVRRLRLEKATFDLLMTTKSLNEITDDVGYGNRSALTKSFKKKYGYNPVVLREKALRATLDAGEYMRVQPEIRELEPFTLLYTRIVHGCCADSTFLETWQSILAFTELDGKPKNEISYFGISKDCPIITARERMRVFAGISGLEDVKPFSVFRVIKITGGRYAVFPFHGDYADIKKLYTYIHRKWIYEVDYEIRDIAFYEKYLSAPTKDNINNIDLEIYIPIKSRVIND